MGARRRLGVGCGSVVVALLVGCGPEARWEAASDLDAARHGHGGGHGHGHGHGHDGSSVGEVVRTADGRVRGFRDGDVLTWYGIPYAAPPTGDLRFRSPEPPAPWSGVRDATVPGSICVQGWDVTVGSEDCLYLNVFVPKGTRRGADLPTMVHLHPGGNAAGSSYEDATALVSRGVVVVTMNYRLNVFGMLGHEALTAEAGHSSNYGLQDQIFALEWVQQNIEAFGGDPDNVTLFGMSAGSFDTTALAASSLTDDLVDRAAIQGTIPWAPSLGEVEGVGAMVAANLGCDPAGDVADCLRAASTEDLGYAKTDFFDDIVPIRDGYVLTDYPRILFEDKKLDLLIGSDREESSVWWWEDDAIPRDLTEEEYIALTGSDWWGYGPLTDWALEVYPVSDYDSPFWAAMTSDTDWAYTCSTRRVALVVSDGHRDVWRYLYTHVYDHGTTDGFPLPELRAAHGMEDDFLWNKFDSSWYEPTQAERRLSAQMSDYWTNFAKTGDPNGRGLPSWPRYSAQREKILLLDTPIEPSQGYHIPQCELQEAAHELFVFSQE